MNASLQLLLNLSELKHLFLDINITKYFKPKESTLSLLFSELLKSKELHTEKAIAPTELKKIVGNMNDQFNGFAQQDSYEFLNFMIDTLHEELNFIRKKPYIENPDYKTFKGNIEQLGKEFWANNLRRNFSIINALFSGQLKSDMICNNCNNKSIIFENFSSLSLPIPESKKIILYVILYRLPFTQKVYHNGIIPGETIRNNLNITKRKSIIKEETNEEVELLLRKKIISQSNSELYTSKLSLSIPIKLGIEVDKSEKVYEIERILRNLTDLDLENIESKKIKNTNLHNKEEAKIDNINPEIQNSVSTLIYASVSNHQLITNVNSKIEDFFRNGDEVQVHELLNTNGLNLLLTNEKTQTPIISLENYGLSIFSQQHQINYHCNQYEYLVEVMHRYNKTFKNEYFVNSSLIKDLEIESRFLILNNKVGITGKMLYELIWEKFDYLLKHPSKLEKFLWWRESFISTNSLDHITSDKICLTPFVLKRVNKENKSCSICPWFKFCLGCLILNDEKEQLILSPNEIIMIEWCESIIRNDIEPTNFDLILAHNSLDDVKAKFLKYQNSYEYTINDCFDLFFEKENLKDDNAIYCSSCKSHQDFTKQYSLSVLPPILIIPIKRFKFNKFYRSKLSNKVGFPIKDMTLNKFHYTNINLNNYDKTADLYDLIGVICHDGSLNSGHYYSYIKINQIWYLFNDSHVSEVEESRIEELKSNCYILVYKKKDYNLMNDTYYDMLQYTITNTKENPISPISDRLKFFVGEPVVTSKGHGYVEKVEKKIKQNEEEEKVIVRLKGGELYEHDIKIHSNITNEIQPINKELKFEGKADKETNLETESNKKKENDPENKVNKREKVNCCKSKCLIF